MKAKILALLLLVVFCFSLAACNNSDLESVLDDIITGSGMEEDETLEIPDSVTNISEDDDKALTGTLTADSYINPYFGLKINKPEGATLESVFDDGTDRMSFSQSYSEGYPGVFIHLVADDGSISCSIEAITEKEKGKSEEDFVQDKVSMENGMNEGLGITSDITTETISIAGEEHPVFIELYSDEDGSSKTINAYLLKGDFKCSLSIYASQEKFDEMFGLIEKN